jgi:hypothetical protein
MMASDRRIGQAGAPRRQGERKAGSMRFNARVTSIAVGSTVA